MCNFTFHCQSIGLYGDAFAVGWAIFNETKILESGYLACPFAEADGPESDKVWIKERVLPILPSTITAKNQKELIHQFWKIWTRFTETFNKKECIGYCAYPVDMNFFEKCVRQNVENNELKAPFPFYEVATGLLAIGEDPLAGYARSSGELPRYNPEKDALHYARMWVETCNKARALWPMRKIQSNPKPDVRYFCAFDAKSVGLYGDLYDVAFVQFNAAGKDQKGSWRIWKDINEAKGLEKDLEYRKKNAMHAYPKSPDCTEEEMREEIWKVISVFNQKQTLFISWCPYPVDFRAIKSAIDPQKEERQFKGVYPLHDLSTLLFLSNQDPNGNYERKSGEEQTKNPVSGAHQCVRLFCDLYREWRNLNIKSKL